VVVGGALTYFKIDSEFETQSAPVSNANAPGGTAIASTVAGGDTTADGFGGVVYATWFGDHFYLDGIAGYAVSSYDLKRNIFIPSQSTVAGVNETAEASPDSQDVSLGIGAGYTWNPGAISWGPYFRLDYLNADIDGYSETGADVSGLNLKVDGQDWTSLTSVLGGSFSWAISSGSGVIVPQARLGWVHQFENESSFIDAVYVADPRSNVLRAATDDPEEDYAELGLAVSSVFQSGGQVFFSYDTLLGFENLTSHLFTLGGRWEF
jgi:outer membrane autotransporter protein